MYKICVYAICKNESKFIDKWLESMSEADYIVVLDTGSTDGSFKRLAADKRVTKVQQRVIDPWRFDVARNASMELIPEDADICVCTDFDEVFTKGWADIMRNAWGEGITRLHYTYAWGHNALDEPQHVFKYDKAHARHGYHWVYAVHEIVRPIEPDTQEGVVDLGTQVWLHHYPDPTKSRKFYFDLLELACQENPDDPHINMLYAREFLVQGNKARGIEEFLRVLKMPAIDQPRYRMVLLNCLLQVAMEYELQKNYDEAIWYAQEFIKEDPTYREPYLLLAEMYNQMQMYTLAEACVNAAKEYSYQHYSWVEWANTYLGWLFDVESISKFNLHKYPEAIAAIDQAVSHDPENIRLIKNQNLMLKAYTAFLLEKK